MARHVDPRGYSHLNAAKRVHCPPELLVTLMPVRRTVSYSRRSRNIHATHVKHKVLRRISMGRLGMVLDMKRGGDESAQGGDKLTVKVKIVTL